MKLSHPRITLLLLVLVSTTAGCGYVNSIRAKSQLNEAVSAYKDKKFEEAEQYARKALYLDPDNENAPQILAIILQTEFRRGDPSEINLKRAQEAIDLYRKIEERDPNSEIASQAFPAVTVLYGHLVSTAQLQIAEAEKGIAEAEAGMKPASDKPEDQKKPEELKALADKKAAAEQELAKWKKAQEGWTAKQQEWVEQRAKNENAAKPKRAEAHAFLASKEWQCSLDITERNRTRVDKPGGGVELQYTKPQDQKEFDKANMCMTKGLKLAEDGLSLDPNSETAWAQKYALLKEAEKLAKMEGDQKKAAEYNKQSTDAAKIITELRQKANAAATPQPAG